MRPTTPASRDASSSTQSAHTLEAEIEELKARAGWTVEKQKAVEAGGPLAPPQPPKPYTYRLRTDPGAAYRTVCVRLCDGFYYPVNEAARPGSFLAEEKMCQSTCSVPARLFYQRFRPATMPARWSR